jgi:hypothetical protein
MPERNSRNAGVLRSDAFPSSRATPCAAEETHHDQIAAFEAADHDQIAAFDELARRIQSLEEAAAS